MLRAVTHCVTLASVMLRILTVAVEKNVLSVSRPTLQESQAQMEDY